MPVRLHDLIDHDLESCRQAISAALVDEHQGVIILSHGTEESVAGMQHQDFAVVTPSKNLIWFHCCDAGKGLAVSLSAAWHKPIVGFVGKILFAKGPRGTMHDLLRSAGVAMLPQLDREDLEEWLKEDLRQKAQAHFDAERDIMAAAAVATCTHTLRVFRP